MSTRSAGTVSDVRPQPSRGPIFIVGASRSGTELARSILNRHNLIHIGLETHWFDDLRPRLADPRATPTTDEQALILRYLLSVATHGYGLRNDDIPEVQRDALFDKWLSVGTSADDAFIAHCLLQAEQHGKPIWGEKTPRHLFRVDEILALFPDAKILVCVRDPRGVVASYRDWRNNWFDPATLSDTTRAAVEAEERRTQKSFGLTLATLLWRSAASTGLRVRAQWGDDRVYLLRFEDLLAEPERVLRAVTAWLGVPFDPEMLNVQVSNSSYIKVGTVQHFDQSAAMRWRERLTAEEAGYISWLAKADMKKLGYVDDVSGGSPFFIARSLGLLPLEFFRAFTANRARMGNVFHFLAARLRALR